MESNADCSVPDEDVLYSYILINKRQTSLQINFLLLGKAQNSLPKVRGG